MKNYPIEKFGTKLMVRSKSVNKIPYEYLSYSKNLRIYDGGIGVRKGFTSAYEGGQGNNNGGFTLNGSLYQVESGKIYKLDIVNGTRVEISDLGYDSRIDVLVSQNTKGVFTSIGTETVTYTKDSNFDDEWISKVYFREEERRIKFYISGKLGGERVYDEFTAHNIATDNTGYALPAVRILDGNLTFKSAGGSFDDGVGIITVDSQYASTTNDTPSSVSFDIDVGYYTSSEVAIITSNGRNVKVFDGVNITDVSEQNTGIIEFTGGKSFLSSANVLKASRPVSLINPEYAYDWDGTNSYQIVYDSEIRALSSTLGGLYVFTSNKIEYISAANTVSGLSIPIGRGGEVMNQFCVVSSGEKIFYLTKNLEIETVNYISGTSDTQIGKLSSVKVVNIRELLKNLDLNQDSAFSYSNRDDSTIQFFLRSQGSLYNDVCVVYDLINETWNIDTGRNFNYIIEYNQVYYAFSDLNASVYQDGIGYTNDGLEIDSEGHTQNMNLRTPAQKIFTGMYSAGSIGTLSSVKFEVEIDENSIMNETMNGNSVILNSGIGDSATGDLPVGGESFADNENPFNIEANEGRIWQYGDRMKIKFSGVGVIQNFVIDTLGIKYEPTQVTIINNTL